jgi:TRAP transporter TAXI family solute receptor
MKGKGMKVTIGVVIMMVVAGTFAQPARAKMRIGLATVAPTMGSYPAVVAVANFLNRNTNLDLTVSSVGGAIAIATSVEKMKETGLGMGMALPVGMVRSAYDGTIEYKGKPNRSLRVMILNYWDYRGVFTIPGSGITSLSQAKGKRFPRFLRTRNAEYPPIFQAYGVDYNRDLKLINVPSPGKGARELGLGRLDLSGGTIGGSKIVKLSAAAGGVIVLPIDPAKFSQAKAKHPQALFGFDSVVLPPGESSGVINKKPTPVIDFKMVSFAHEDLPEEAVYTYVKTLLDNVARIKKMNRLFKRFSVESAAPLIGVPYHGGSVKALKEKGLWTAAHEEQQRQLLK